MATHSSVLAWRIPGTGGPGGLPTVGLHSQIQLKQLSSSSSIYLALLFFFLLPVPLLFKYSHGHMVMTSESNRNVFLSLYANILIFKYLKSL